MAGEIVKFKNDMNRLKFAGLGKNDMNLFMAICSKVREQKDSTVYIRFDYLCQISHYTGHTIDGFVNDLKRMSKRIMAVNCEIIMDNGGFDVFNLFQRFIADTETQILTVKINPDFTWLLNEFADKIKGYTTFDLQEFVGLQSKYAKNLFRLLKQWRSTGQYIFSDINEFREKMDVPKAYSNMRLMTKIIEPAVREINKLDKSFTGFKCEPLYARKRGKPLTGYKFTWKAENTGSYVPEQPLKEYPAETDKLSEPGKNITSEEKDRLVSEFGAELTEEYIKRTKAYKCCNYATIREWILEDREKKQDTETRCKVKNQFNNFPQREFTQEYMNSLKFTGFTTTDFNFLMALCSRMKDKGTNEITFSFSELRNMTDYKKSNSIQQFIADIKKMNDKLMKITCSLETKTEIIMFVLFPTFIINLEQQTLTVAVNENFKFILNELVKNFTHFDLKEFVALESKHSKTLYRLLKQFKTTGIFEIKLDDLRKKMDCPVSYSNKYVMDKLIKPSLKELKNYFIDLQCTVQYAHKKGRPVEGYIFTFKPEQQSKSALKEYPSETDKPSEPGKDITGEEKDRLVSEFGAELTEEYIKRTKAYKCCNYATIREWILEDNEKKQNTETRCKVQNQFNNFPQREFTQEYMDSLEHTLLNKH